MVQKVASAFGAINFCVKAFGIDKSCGVEEERQDLS